MNMRIISIVGKVDSRVIAYPLARGLSINGLTGIITDDGAYRRLYPGNSNIGSVNGIDISVTGHVDENSVHSLDNSGINYDNLVTVSCDYIHPEADGIIVCHGLDRSMMLKDETDEDDDFIFPIKNESQSEADTSEKKGKVGFGRSKPKSDDSDNADANKPNQIDGNTDVVDKPNTNVKETEHDRIIRLQNENPDRILIPANKKYVEVQIAYAAAPKNKDIIGISIKDGLMNYVYTCEEQKRIAVNADKAYVTVLAKILSSISDITASEAQVLLTKEEGSESLTKSGKPKR